MIIKDEAKLWESIGNQIIIPIGFRGLRRFLRGYGEETLRAVPKLPSKNAEFAKVVVWKGGIPPG